MHADQELEAVGHLLAHRDLDPGVDIFRPRAVGLLKVDAAGRIDSAEADEGLTRAVRVDPVDVHQLVHVRDAAMHERRVEGHAPAELPLVAADELVGVGLVELRIEFHAEQHCLGAAAVSTCDCRLPSGL